MTPEAQKKTAECDARLAQLASELAEIRSEQSKRTSERAHLRQMKLKIKKDDYITEWKLVHEFIVSGNTNEQAATLYNIPLHRALWFGRNTPESEEDRIARIERSAIEHQRQQKQDAVSMEQYNARFFERMNMIGDEARKVRRATRARDLRVMRKMLRDGYGFKKIANRMECLSLNVVKLFYMKKHADKSLGY